MYFESFLVLGHSKHCCSDHTGIHICSDISSLKPTAYSTVQFNFDP